MSYMFQHTGYKSTVLVLDLGDKFDTSQVTNMEGMFSQVGYTSPVFTLDFGNKFDTSKVSNMKKMFYSVGHANDNLELDLSSFNFDKVKASVTYYTDMFRYYKATQKLFVKDVDDQNWIIGHTYSHNLSTNNVLIKGT